MKINLEHVIYLFLMKIFQKSISAYLTTITIKSIFIITQIDIHTHVDTYNQKNTILPQRVYVRKALCLSFSIIIYYIQGYFPEKETFFQTQTFVIRPR